MSETEKQEIINALKVIKSTCMSYKNSKEIEGDPCIKCPFCIDDNGNCFFYDCFYIPAEWRITKNDYWRAIDV